MFGLKKWRRNRLLSRPFPVAWLRIIEKNIPYYQRLCEADRRELQQHVQVFIAEKHFEGCGGLTINDEIRVTIAAQACILLLHRETDYYPGLYSILIYPSAFIAKTYDELAPGTIVAGNQVHLGESWKHGALVLAWDHVQISAADIHDGHNVVLHEFAHQLDTENGAANGAPPLPQRSMYVAWARILGKDYQKLRDDAEHGRRTVLDHYGATNPAEFFAVATECFFEKSREMRSHHPELYAELSRFYRQDPAALDQKADCEDQPWRGGEN